ncbi:MAG: metal-dependent transcriptional regulator [Candidatus Riflebacteria bacterium]|nr:metal-dependent transcriptional regulator [Candidatus Riflebacteria bacterium]
MERVSLALESYLEAIADIQNEQGAVSPSVLAEKMGCKRSSVTSALQRLAENGLINYHTYRPVTLSQKGKEVIESLDKYHKILANFFENVLGLEEEFSQKEACRLEHQISPKTIERIAEYVEFLDKPDAFIKFLKSKK